ncbi:hypothetical protein DSAG12_04335 [Promethearchaeum syntrophicum]|uniref:Uncharacterized protein n=1 Tax=Promethearchaeum syntrophicum TaxID=2594042 RepID=A0AC61ZU15_9ARCH
MAKPKPSEKMDSIRFTIPESEKKIWKEYAKGLGFPLARIIKETMNQRINNFKANSSKTENEIMKELQNLSEKINFLNVKVEKKIIEAPIPKIEIDKDEIRSRIEMFLSEFPNGLTRKKLITFLNIDSKIVRKILVEMKNDNIIYNEDLKWRLV